MTPAVRAIVAAVAADAGIDPAALLGPSRRWTCLHPRQLAMTLARELTARSLPALGRDFGRHHTTVLNALREIAGRADADPALAVRLAQLRAALEAHPDVVALRETRARIASCDQRPIDKERYFRRHDARRHDPWSTAA